MTAATLPVFIKDIEGKSPVPLEINPVTFPLVTDPVHVNVVPETLDVQVTGLLDALEQTVSVRTTFVTNGVGSTVNCIVLSGPAQPFAVGVTVIKPINAVFVEFTPIKDGISTEPVEAKPI
jgi:hypothetical protein